MTTPQGLQIKFGEHHGLSYPSGSYSGNHDKSPNTPSSKNLSAYANQCAQDGDSGSLMALLQEPGMPVQKRLPICTKLAEMGT